MSTNSPGYKELLAQLISFDTTSSNTNLPLIRWLDNYLQGYSFKTRIFYNEDHTKANLVATIGPDVSGGFMLAGHTDVVPVEGQPWDTPPFQLTETQTTLTGRGTADMKGFIALVCDAITTIDPGKLTNPVYLVFTYDEEVGCFGARALQGYLKTLASNIQFALIGEPTNFALVNAHKGLQVTHSTFTGKPAHSSCPHLGSNAILAAVEFLRDMASTIPEQEDPRFNPPASTFNAGTIHGGNAVNIIAEHCQLEWECRTIPAVDIAGINKGIAHISQNITGHSKVTIEHKILSQVPGLTADRNEKIIELLKEFLPRDIKTATAPFVTEAGLFQQANIPTVVFGPGDLEQAHQPNESVSIEAMNRYRTFLLNLISHYCH